MTQQEPQGCLFVILKLFGFALPSEATATQLPYQRKNYLFSKAERSFFGVLQTAVGAEYLIFAKVRLADLISVPRGTEKWQSFFNRIQSKHIDFVLCDPNNVGPVLAIELDDSSHERADRQDRDGFVDSALAAAGLPILHIAAKHAYNAQDLANRIRQQVGV